MNLFKRILIKSGDLLGLFSTLSESENSLRKLALTVGWNLDDIVGLPVEELTQTLSEVATSYQHLVVEDIIESSPESLSQFIDTFNSAGQLLTSLQRLQSILESPDFVMPPQFEDFAKDLLQIFTVSYLRGSQPVLFHLLVLLSIIEDEHDLSYREPIINSQGKVMRFPCMLPKFRFDRIPELIKNPELLLRDEYIGPNGFATADDAAYTSKKLFRRLDALLSALGFNVVYGIKPEYGLDFGEAGNELGAGMLTVYFESYSEDIDFGFTLALSSADRGNLGLVVTPFGEMNFSSSLENWLVELAVEGSVGGFAIGPNGFTLIADENTRRLNSQFTANKIPNEFDKAFILGSDNGTRFEVSQFKVSGALDLSEDLQNYGMLIEFGSASLVIASGDGDGFLQKILPSDGVRADFDLAIGWSNKNGLYFRGSAGLEATLPIQFSLFGVLSIESIYLAIKTDGEGIENTVAASIRAKIGPVEAFLDKIGLEVKCTAPEDGGNLGPLNLDFDFKSPTSIGLTIDAEGITGGGFLEIDPPNYAGMMQLSFKNEIELTAFGLITTKLPDGADGFSMVIQIMAEFQPIQIGLGFALTGVGGLIGINRQINEDGLIEAFKNHSLDAFLFPENPIRDAVKIIESIQTIMPPREGYHIIGPMVQMFWGGSVKLVEFEVGIFIQTGGPLKIVIIGQARTHLPEGDSPRLVINLDVLGIIDLGEERVAMDAALFNSRILNFTLDGKMALRADWSSGEESFALSIGGFHPQFQNIPAGFPKLTRLMVSIGSGNPRLTLQMYLAITPNTLQIGAKFDLWAKKSGFTITGGTSFDALFTFSPFSFLVIIKIWANIKRGWFNIGVDLELELSGPNPMIAAGYAKFKIGWFSKKVRFRKQFGDKQPEPLPVVSPIEVLLAELENARSVRFELPAWASAGLVFTKAAESRIDPTADILISQNAVPLNFSMQRFGGGRPPEVEQKLSITAGFEADKEKVTKTLFAPEQFKNWSVDERLAAKPFEMYDAGIRFSGEYIIPEDAVEERPAVFETVLRESRDYRQKQPKGNFRGVMVRTTCFWQPSAIEAQYLMNWSLFGSSSYFKPLRKVRDENQPGYIKVTEPRFIVAGRVTQDGKFSNVARENQDNSEMSYAEALDARKRTNDTNSIIRSTADVFSH